MTEMLRWKRIKPLGGIAAAVVMALALASCDSAPSANPVSDLATTVNSETGSDFKAYDNEAYFGLVYNIEDTPANRARILVLGENSELFEKRKHRCSRRSKRDTPWRGSSSTIARS